MLSILLNRIRSYLTPSLLKTRIRAQQSRHQTKFGAEFYDIDVTEQHPHTAAVAIKHCEDLSKWVHFHRIPPYSIQAFQNAKAFVDRFYGSEHIGPRPIILDSGCGVGMSTYKLAQQYKTIPVIGIDRSGHRLDKVLEVESVVVKESATIQSENAFLVRAELSDFWLLVFRDPSLIVHRNYLLYPNPYPKRKHLQRRWHGHPTFPVLLGLGGTLTIRSNWKIYCEEFMTATQSAMDLGFIPPIDISSGVQLYTSDNPMTHFETKYSAVGVPLFQMLLDLGQKKIFTGNSLQ